MAVNVALPLFGTPGQEMEEGAALDGRRLRGLGADLHARLDKAADALDKLTAAGWTAWLGFHDALLAHRDVQTEEDARRKIQEAGLNPDDFVIIEEVSGDDSAPGWSRTGYA